jgi:hypothetical protein
VCAELDAAVAVLRGEAKPKHWERHDRLLNSATG